MVRAGRHCLRRYCEPAPQLWWGLPEQRPREVRFSVLIIITSPPPLFRAGDPLVKLQLRHRGSVHGPVGPTRPTRLEATSTIVTPGVARPGARMTGPPATWRSRVPACGRLSAMCPLALLDGEQRPA
jgi:hypothetical protein